jgi:hypothetical protein
MGPFWKNASGNQIDRKMPAHYAAGRLINY